MSDARSGCAITIDPCGLGPTHTVHRAELVVTQSVLQLCAGNEDVRILTDSKASMDGMRPATTVHELHGSALSFTTTKG